MKRKILSVAFMALLTNASSSTWANNTWAAYPAWNRSSDSDGLVINKWFAGASAHLRVMDFHGEVLNGNNSVMNKMDSIALRPRSELHRTRDRRRHGLGLQL